MTSTTDSGEVVASIARAVQARGGRALLVGGCVRDVMLGLERKDFDLEVFGVEASVLEALLRERYPLHEVGRAFGILKIQGHDIDLALPRRETKIAAGHRGFAVDTDPHLDLESAALRRDFTINAIYEDPLTGEVIDPLNGRADLEKRTLRHCSAHFGEDPLRVLRAMQLAARFNLMVAPSTLEQCRRLDLEELPAERVEGEFRKLLLEGQRPSRGLQFLKECGALRFFPEIQALDGVPQNPQWHPEGDVFVHTGHCLDHFALERSSPTEDWIVGLALLCHDFGKPSTTRLERGAFRSPGHSEAGEAPTRSFLARLSREPDLIETVVKLVLHHLRPYEMYRDNVGDSAIRRLATQVNLRVLVRVARHDSAGRPPLPFDGFPAGEWLMQRARALEIADQAPRPIVMGRHLIERGLTPGPEFKSILDRCFEAQLDGVFSDLEGGLSFLDRMHPAPSPSPEDRPPTSSPNNS